VAQSTDEFTKEDFAHIADLIRQWSGVGSESVLRATLSNNLNVILAALDAAAVAPDLLDALKAMLVHYGPPETVAAICDYPADHPITKTRVAIAKAEGK
jgi:hypothetical protein